MDEEREQVDYVLVWEENHHSDHKATADKEKRQIFEDNLRNTEKLELTEEKAEGTNLTFVKIWAPTKVLIHYAEILKYRIPLKELPLHMKCSRPSPRKRLSVQTLLCNKLTCLHISPDTYNPNPPRKKKVSTIYTREKRYLFDFDNSEAGFFTSTVRARIIFYILRKNRYAEEPKGESEEKDFRFGIDRLLRSNVYLAAYPLHDGDAETSGSQRYFLSQEWASFSKCFKFQPLYEIKDYFGIQIAMYFAWLGFYTRMLIPAAIFGIFCFIYGVSSLATDDYSNDVCDPRLNITMCPLCDLYCAYWNIQAACFHAKLTHLFDNETTVFFAAFMSIWTAVFLEYWKRYDAKLTFEWDLTGFDIKDQNPRPEYFERLKSVQRKKVNPVTREEEPYVSFFRHRLPYMLLSFSTVTFLICLATAAVIAVVVYRVTLKLVFNKLANDEPGIQSKGTLIVTTTAAMLNLLFIILFNWIYEGLADKLTEWEIHRTQYEFDDSYTFKIYLLQFVNYYSSIFYVAFFKGIFVGSPDKFRRLFGQWRQEECKIGCMPELCIQLAVVMIGKQLKSSIVQLVMPFYYNWKRHVKWRRLENDPQKPWINDFKLVDCSKKALIDEYIEMVIQYGFVTIFVTAFPLAPFFALLNNIFEVRLDAKKLIHYQKRPIPLRVKDIGVWYPIMEFIGKFSILSNAFIIAITSKFIPQLVYRFTVFDYDDPRFGTLQGFLNHSLATFSTNDLEVKPLQEIIETRSLVQTCRYPVYRYSYKETANLRYKPNEFFWHVWLTRVVFILLFQNVVSVIVILTRWIIPDIPQKLKDKIAREEHLTNEHINKLSENKYTNFGRRRTISLNSNLSHLNIDPSKTNTNYSELNETSKLEVPSLEKDSKPLDDDRTDLAFESLQNNEEEQIDNAEGGELDNSNHGELETLSEEPKTVVEDDQGTLTEEGTKNLINEESENVAEENPKDETEEAKDVADENLKNETEEETKDVVEIKHQEVSKEEPKMATATITKAENGLRVPGKRKPNLKIQTKGKPKQKPKSPLKKPNQTVKPKEKENDQVKKKKGFACNFCK